MAKNKMPSGVSGALPCLPSTRAAEPAHKALRGRSSLRLAGEVPPRLARHIPKVPGQTRTWSSIETIAALTEVRRSVAPTFILSANDINPTVPEFFFL